jgi:hypothetical protein
MGYTENSRTVVIASESHIYAEPRQEQEGTKSADLEEQSIAE